MSREYSFQGGAWVPSICQGATTLVCFSCQAIDFNDAHNQLEDHLDKRFGSGRWQGWISEFDGFLNLNGKGWDWDYMRVVKDNPATLRRERSQGTAATIAAILNIPAEQVEVV